VGQEYDVVTVGRPPLTLTETTLEKRHPKRRKEDQHCRFGVGTIRNSRLEELEGRASCEGWIGEDKRRDITLRKSDQRKKVSELARALLSSSLTFSSEEIWTYTSKGTTRSDVGKLTDLTDSVREDTGSDRDRESRRRDEEEGEEEGEGGAHCVEEKESGELKRGWWSKERRCELGERRITMNKVCEKRREKIINNALSQMFSEEAR